MDGGSFDDSDFQDAIAEYIRWRDRIDTVYGIVIGVVCLTVGILIGAMWR